MLCTWLHIRSNNYVERFSLHVGILHDKINDKNYMITVIDF